MISFVSIALGGIEFLFGFGLFHSQAFTWRGLLSVEV
jgi:hypothetical protein